MRLTPQQQERMDAQDNLQRAVERHVAAYRGDDDGIVADWVLISSTSGFDDDGKGTSGYYLAFMGGEMAEHRAVGLMMWGKHMIESGEANGDDDDDT